jgi:DNA (cytosine-5)-methyltransferase 1
MKLLDTYCGAGGAGVGYHKAGFDVVGVDINPQSNYPFEFHQGDAVQYILDHGHEFDAIHASPPCQAFCRTSFLHGNPAERHPDLIPATRAALKAAGVPYVIENVPDAPLLDPVMLCGTMFAELKVYRHRMFECGGFTFTAPGKCNHAHKMGKTKGEYHSLDKSEYITCAGHNFEAKSGRIAMQMDWATRDEIAQAVPPAYTWHIGRALIHHLTTVRNERDN